MTGRVLSEEEIQVIIEKFTSGKGITSDDFVYLIAIIRDRDKTIEKLQRRISFHSDLNGDLSELCKYLQQQNALMLSAFEQLRTVLDEWMSIPYRNSFILTQDVSAKSFGIVSDTIAQVKALNAK